MGGGLGGDGVTEVDQRGWIKRDGLTPGEDVVNDTATGEGVNGRSHLTESAAF